MSFDLQQIETQLSLLEWRNTQLEAITGQLERAFPSLMDMIETKVAEISLIKVAQAQVNPKTLAESVIAPWAEEQGHIALKRAEEGLSKIVTSLQADVELGEHLRAALPALAGVGVIATSVLGLPAVVSFATLTSTSFLIFTTSTISFPILIAGGAALTGLSFVGFKTVDYAKGKTRAYLVQRIQAMARAAVFGYGLPPEAHCIINDLQAVVLKAGQSKLEEVI